MKSGTSPIRPRPSSSPASAETTRTPTRAGGSATPASPSSSPACRAGAATACSKSTISAIRDFGLPGHQPGATGPVPSDLHGPISTRPQGNRLYLAYGPLNGGIFQILDRDKLLQGPKEPTPENLRYPEVGRLHMSPLHGAH